MSARSTIARIQSTPDGWVRVEFLRHVRGGLELELAVHRGKRGPRLSAWRVRCEGVRDTHISDLSGGGIRLYPSIHPAARQYVAARAQLRVADSEDLDRVLGILLRAHVAMVDDWIPFDRYVKAGGASHRSRRLLFRGPDFLMRVYARALRGRSLLVRFSATPARKGRARPQVLHFGDSYIVANAFSVREV
jgi:hypothetical protein